MGLTGVGVNLGLLWLTVEGLGWSPLLAAVLAIEASTVSNFLLNRAWTWADRDRSWWSLLTYHGVTAIGMLTQWGVLLVLHGFLGVHYLLAASLGILAGTAWNFFGNDRHTFTPYSAQRRKTLARVTLYGAALLLQVVIASLLSHDWDTFVFQKSVEDFVLDGNTPYEVGEAKPDYVYVGTGVPVQARWYAYPPLPLLAMALTYAPVALGLASSPWLGRLLIKVPFVLSNLLLAWAAHRMARTTPHDGPDAERKAARLERFLLFNPLFLMVAAIWGQFESLVLLLLLASFLSLRTDRYVGAGVLFGLATLVKIFPLYLGPLLLVHLWRRGGFRAPLKYFAAGAGVFILVSLPFFLLQPHGFLEQVFFMHANRNPGRFAPIALLFGLLNELSRRSPGLFPDNAGLIEALSLLSFTLTFAVVSLLAFASTRRAPTERNLLLWSALTMMGGLLCTKVVSEQYMLLPIGLFAFYHFHPAPETGLATNLSRRYLLLTTAFMTVATLLDSAHFLVFFPADVAEPLLGTSVPHALLFLANSLGVTYAALKTSLDVIGAIGLIFPFIITVRILAPALREGLVAMVGHLPKVRIHVPTHPRALAAVVSVTIALLLVPALAVGVLAPKGTVPLEEAGTLESDAVLAHYRTDWFNPTNRLDLPEGSWSGATLTPADGFYNSFSHKIDEDLAQMEAAGIDGVVLPLNPAFELNVFAAAQLAESRRIPYALEVDLGHLADDQGRVEITPATAKRTRQMLEGPFFSFWDRTFHMRLGPDGGNLVFLAGAARLQPTFSQDERQHVARLVHEILGDERVATIEHERGVPLWQMAPTSAWELASSDNDEVPWRLAYQEAAAQWWAESLDLPAMDVPFDILLDAPASAIPNLPEGVRITGRFEAVPSTRPNPSGPPVEEAGALAFALVEADPIEPSSFQDDWIDAIASHDGILLPWNDFDVGSAIEPTFEFGDELLARTQELAVGDPDADPADARTDGV